MADLITRGLVKRAVEQGNELSSNSWKSYRTN